MKPIEITQGSPGAASAFYAVLLAEALAAMPRVTAPAVPRLLPYLEAGLAPAASAEQYAGALMVATQLASRAPLALPLTEALLEGVAKGARAPLHAQALQASLALCQTQAVKTLPGRAFKHLVKLPDLPGHFADLCRGYRADALAVPLVVALAQSAATHANYERVLAGVVESAPLSDAAVAALARALVAAAQSSTAAHDVAQRALRSLETRFPRAISIAVDAILSESAAKASSSAEAERAARAAAEFLRQTLAGSAAGPMPGHAASLGAALDHPSAGLREAALRELRKGGKSGALKNGALSGALLRRVVDDHPRVASAAAALPGLRAAVDDDDALFDAAAERLAAASAACSGKHADAESERAVAKRCVSLACAALAAPFEEGESGETGESSGSDDSDSESEERIGGGGGGGARVGAVAGRGAALAFGHLTFSPSTRAVARAAIDAARRNRHPALSGLRGKRFKRAMESAKAPGSKAPKEKKTKSKKPKADGGGPVVDKETRALMDAAANRAVIEALAEGLASDPGSWGGDGALTLWATDAWRVGSPRARATLLLALRRAAEGSLGDDGFPEANGGDRRDDAFVSCATPRGVAAARRALWTLVKETWFGEHGGGAFLDADAPFEACETPSGDGVGVGARAGAFELDDSRGIKASTFRAVAKHDARAVAALARSAVRTACSFGAEDEFNPSEAFDLVAASWARSGAACATRVSLEAAAESILRALGEDAPAFLAARAARDPAAGENDTAEVPRVALDLLARRGGVDASESVAGASTLAALVAACCASDPATRAAAARAVAALAPAAVKQRKKSSVNKKSAKASPSVGGADVAAVWAALAAAGDDFETALGASADSARAATSAALAEGLKGDEAGAATRALLAPAAAFADGFETETVRRHRLQKSAPSIGLSARGATRLVAAMRGAGSDAVKTEALAPALELALASAVGPPAADGDASETARASDVAALAAEILATYTPACAAEGVGVRAWRAFGQATVAHGADAAPAPARVAATTRLTRDFVAALHPERRRWALRALFVAVAGDPDAGARAAARDAVDALDVRAGDVCALLEAATEAARGGSSDRGGEAVAKKSRKTKPASAEGSRGGGSDADADADADAATGAKDAVNAAIAALEVLAWKPVFDADGGISVLVPACRAFLAASLDAAALRGEEERDETRGGGGGGDARVAARAAASGGYAQALVLSTLEALARRAADRAGKTPRETKTPTKVSKKAAKKSSKAADADVDADADADTFWDVPLVVRAARDAEAGPARDAALSLLGALAAADPRGVMRRALEVSAALTHRASDPDAGSAPASHGGGGAEDASSRRALEEALGAIVPAWIAGGLGVDAACERVVYALPEAPAHRRAGLCAAFLKATRGLEDVASQTYGGDGGASPNPGLAVVAASLLTRARGLEAAAEASARARAAKAARRAAKEGGAAAAAALEAIEIEKTRAVETASAWVGDLVATLLARETATAAVHALARVAEVRRGPPDKKRTKRAARSRDARFFSSPARERRDRNRTVRSDPNRTAPRCCLADDHHLPCQDSDALLFVERRVETLSSAAFLLRDGWFFWFFWFFLGFRFPRGDRRFVATVPLLFSFQTSKHPTDRRVPLEPLRRRVHRVSSASASVPPHSARPTSRKASAAAWRVWPRRRRLGTSLRAPLSPPRAARRRRRRAPRRAKAKLLPATRGTRANRTGRETNRHPNRKRVRTWQRRRRRRRWRRRSRQATRRSPRTRWSCFAPPRRAPRETQKKKTPIRRLRRSAPDAASSPRWTACSRRARTCARSRLCSSTATRACGARR